MCKTLPFFLPVIPYSWIELDVQLFAVARGMFEENVHRCARARLMQLSGPPAVR